MIHTMDAVRLYNTQINGQTIKKSCSSISIGSAPRIRLRQREEA